MKLTLIDNVKLERLGQPARPPRKIDYAGKARAEKRNRIRRNWDKHNSARQRQAIKESSWASRKDLVARKKQSIIDAEMFFGDIYDFASAAYGEYELRRLLSTIPTWRKK